MRLIIGILWCFLSVCSFAQAKEFPEDSTLLPAEEVFSGDYYALGDLVEVAGVVQGNAYLAGTQVQIDGEIQGNLFVVAGSLEIKGKVQGKVWALAGGATFTGDVGELVLLAASAQLNQGGKIQRDLTLCAGNAEIDDWIGGNATVLASNLKISGTIDHNLKSFAGKLRILSGAWIKGDLRYKSNEVALIDSAARIGGSILYQHSPLRDFRGVVIGSKIAAFLMNFLYTLVMGIVIIRLFPHKLSGALSALHTAPLKSFLHGLVLLVLFPLASLVLLITVIGAPFALTLIALNIITLYTAKIFTILWGANWLFSRLRWKKNGVCTLLGGQVIYSILVSVPFLGPSIAFFVMVIGLGAVVVSRSR
ncbi:MAG: polymer-forming cytoskeletal protein [Rhabdochlamydiaceae bacterium]|nr:polymer-forming cytoskeletal protein [Rhabdochlamydiaceae bacterium]